MKKTTALADALRRSGSTVAAGNGVTAAPAPSTRPDTPRTQPLKRTQPRAQTTYTQPSRRSTKPITVHHPEEVRRQLKILAAEQGRKIEHMVGEAFNLLFAKYRKAEIAPTDTDGHGRAHAGK
jgi:hypothetical protein